MLHRPCTSTVLAGFLLTAIPNWTNRPAVQGVPLAGLFALWLVGRVAMLETEPVGGLFEAIVDGRFLIIFPRSWCFWTRDHSIR